VSILKAGFITAVATAAKLLSGLVIIKLVALFSGPEGVAKLGQFMSLMSFLVVFAGGGISSGIVKYVSEYRDDEQNLAKLLHAGSFYTLCASGLIGVFVILFSAKLAEGLLGSIQYQSLLWILAGTQIFMAIHNFIIAIINGYMDVKRIAIIHVFGSVLSLLITAPLAYFFHLYGALLALVLGQASLLLVSLSLFKNCSNFNANFLLPKFDLKKIKLLSRYSLMTLTSAVLAPIVQIAVRNHLAEKFSWEETGYWQAVSKVSEAYLLFITMSISVYYLPKLSKITDQRQFVDELKNAYRYLMPVVIFLALFIYVFRNLITLLLFSKDFTAGNYLYAPQLIGDVIKIASFLLSYIMLAKAMTKVFFLSELIFSLTYVLLVFLFTNYFGLIGAMSAFGVNYVIYLLFTVIVANRFIRGMQL